MVYPIRYVMAVHHVQRWSSTLCFVFTSTVILTETAGALTRCQGQSKARAYIGPTTATNVRGQVHPSGMCHHLIFGQVRRGQVHPAGMSHHLLRTERSGFLVDLILPGKAGGVVGRHVSPLHASHLFWHGRLDYRQIFDRPLPST